MDTGFCTTEELDTKVKSKMRMLPEKDALDAIDEINAVPRDQIRNFGSYFMGIMNRYMRGERQNRQNKHNKEHHVREGRRHDGHDGRGHRGNNGENERRYSHYGRDDNRGRRSRGSDRRSGKYLDSDARHTRRRTSRSRSYSRSRSRSRSRSLSPEYRRRRSRSRDRDDDRSRSRRRDRDSDRNRRSSSHRDYSKSIISPTKNYGHNPPSIAHYVPPPPPPPPPPRPPMIAPLNSLPMTQTTSFGILTGQSHEMMSGGLQQTMKPTQQVQQLMQPSSQMPGQPQLSQGANFQQMQQQFFQQATPNLNPHQIQNLLNQGVTQQQLQAILQSQSSNTNQMLIRAQAGNPANMLGQTQGTQSGNSQLASLPGTTTWSIQNPVQNQAPLDILGLADKAAQVLSQQINLVPAPVPNANFPPPPSQLWPGNTAMQVSQPFVTEGDLPTMVRYAVQVRMCAFLRDFSSKCSLLT